MWELVIGVSVIYSSGTNFNNYVINYIIQLGAEKG